MTEAETLTMKISEISLPSCSFSYWSRAAALAMMRPAAMTQPQEDAGGEPAASSVDVVGGGQYSGYHAWQANKDISGARLAHAGALCRAKSPEH